MANGGFIVQDTIRVLTQNGECHIEFCLGDITSLKQEDRVDVLLVSAFQNNYEPSPSSLIGALAIKLNLSVHQLAQDKEEDLRQYYSCWWSKPLPRCLPFGRILCFETRRMGGHPKEVVGNAFRCLVPILKDQNSTVMTPLLTAGNQGFGERGILKSMVDAGVNWMKVGLPLKRLKIVLYAKVEGGQVTKNLSRQYSSCIELFEELKEKYDMQYLMPQEIPIRYDVYLSYSKEDEKIAKIIEDELKEGFPDIRIFIGPTQEMEKGATWQEDMYNVMMESARVVTVISPNYLNNTACVEQYNIALCCNRRAHRDMLAPFYVESVPSLPSYMELVQYVECLKHDKPKIINGCKDLLKSLREAGEKNLVSDVLLHEPEGFRYDMFLSYSHKDSEKVNNIVECFKALKPDLKLFFDVQELKQGKAWQRTLYHSIDSTNVFVAFVSDPYVRSAVCNEEYSIALAKFWSKVDPLQLVLVEIDKLTETPTVYKKVPIHEIDQTFDKWVKDFCKQLIDFVVGKKTTKSFITSKEVFVDVDIATAEIRKLNFQDKFGSYKKQLQKLSQTAQKEKDTNAESTNAEFTQEKDQAKSCNIALSYHRQDQAYAMYIKAFLYRLAPHLTVEMEWSDHSDRLTCMETTDLIIPLLSPHYLESAEQVEDIHGAILRQRTRSPSFPVLYAIQIHTLPRKPTYFHLIPYVANLEDTFWHDCLKEFDFELTKLIGHIYPRFGNKQARLALAYIMHDLVKLIDSLRKSSGTEGQSSLPRPALLNIGEIIDDVQHKSQPKEDGKKEAKITILGINIK